MFGPAQTHGDLEHAILRKCKAILREETMRSITLIFAILISTAASAFEPRVGLWANTAESGSGYAMEIQNGILAMAVYSYQTGGAAQWYLASGPLTQFGKAFSATLDRYQGGQCISCTYSPPTLQGNDGVVLINFESETLATVILPGGRTTVIQPFDFGYGPLPAGFLGEWIFVYDIVAGGASFANRFNFTQTSPNGTGNGNGIAIDAARIAACELQVTGPGAGFVVCVDLDPSGGVENQYTFKYGLDETFSGSWISPQTSNAYAMKGFRVGTTAGRTRADAISPVAHMNATQAGTPTRDSPSLAGPLPTQGFGELADALRSALGMR
jgi:hypothetical protein